MSIITTITKTDKVLKTSAKEQPVKIMKTTTRTEARVTAATAGIGPGTVTVESKTIEEDKTTATPKTTATFRCAKAKDEKKGSEGVSYFLMDITHSEKDKARMEENLIEHVHDTIQILESKSGRIIELIYIGKTHCNVDKRKGKPFDRLNHENWAVSSGINRRWACHQENPKVPSDGMVVLCAFTQHDLPVGSRRSQEFLALTMEQRLIQHFQIFDTRKLVVNDQFKPGNTTKHTKDATRIPSISVLSDNPDLDLVATEGDKHPIPPVPKYCAYVVYMTYSYLPPAKEHAKLRKKQEEALEKQRKEEEEAKRKKQEQKKLKKPTDRVSSDTESSEDEEDHA